MHVRAQQLGGRAHDFPPLAADLVGDSDRNVRSRSCFRLGARPEPESADELEEVQARQKSPPPFQIVAAGAFGLAVADPRQNDGLVPSVADNVSHRREAQYVWVQGRPVVIDPFACLMVTNGGQTATAAPGSECGIKLLEQNRAPFNQPLKRPEPKKKCEL